MRGGQAPGTEGYAEAARTLVEEWKRIPFAERHAPVFHLLPAAPCRVIDIGAGTGADAAAFAGMGHRVVAVEPVAELRLPGMALHASRRIEWIDDSLPDLAVVLARGETFGLIMLTAVWMHLDAAGRAHAMARVASLLAAGGVMIMSLRHGPIPPGRRMFEVSAEETLDLAAAQELEPLLNLRTPSVQEANRRAGVVWTRLAFRKAAGHPQPGLSASGSDAHIAASNPASSRSPITHPARSRGDAADAATRPSSS